MNLVLSYVCFEACIFSYFPIWVMKDIMKLEKRISFEEKKNMFLTIATIPSFNNYFNAQTFNKKSNLSRPS